MQVSVYSFLLFVRIFLVLVTSSLSVDAVAVSLKPDFVEVDLTQEEKAYIQAHPSIKIHSIDGWHPFSFIENGIATGYNNDLIKLVADKVGLKTDFVVGYSWEEYLTKLKNKQIDVISNIKSTRKLQEHFIFTHNQSLTSADGLLTRGGETFNNDFSYIKSIAIVKGFFYKDLIEKHYPHIRITLTNSTEDSIQQLLTGKVDAVLDAYDVINYYAQQIERSLLVINPLLDNPLFSYLPRFMAVHKDNVILRDILDKGLLALNKKERDNLQYKWSSEISFYKQPFEFNYQERMPIFSNQQQEFLNQHGALKVCVDPDWLPIEAIKDGRHIGMASELVSLFAQRISSPIVLLQTDSWPETLAALKSHRCDFIPVIKNTPKRQEYLSFSNPYINFPLALVASKKSDSHYLKDVLHEPLGTLEGGSYYEVLGGLYPDADLREFSSLKAGLEAVERGEIYGFIDVLPVMAKQIQDFYPDLKIVDKFEENYAYSIAVTNDNPILLGIFNKVIDSISLQQKQAIINGWLPVVYETSQHTQGYTVVIVMLIIAMLVMLLLLFFSKKRVRELLILNNHLEKTATRDYLTGLPNKAYFKEQFSKEWVRSQTSGEYLSLLIIDIDNAKGFNQEHGRAIGDECFIELATRLQKIVKRPEDLLARLQEDEFIILLQNTDEEGIKNLAAEIFYMVKSWGIKFKNSPVADAISVSIGAASMIASNNHSENELKRRAEQALYQAQDKGYNQMVIYQHCKKRNDN
jgi:polar amino acid transport system substrate-binding protein